MGYTKRDATPEEESAAIAYYTALNEKDYTDDIKECRELGYKTEVCSCERILPLFIHFVRCHNDGCPFKSKTDNRSLLEMMLGPSPEEKHENSD